MTKNRLAVIGLGYVGMPLLSRAVDQQFDCIGLDSNGATVQRLNAGLSHVDDISDVQIQHALDAGTVFTTDPKYLADADVIVICVPTPLKPPAAPDLTAVIAATEQVARFLPNDALVVLESTTWPGTTAEIVLPILEREGRVVGRDFFLCFSPERIDPGNQAYTFSNTPKVVGGTTELCARRGVKFYQRLVDEVVLAKGTREAEMAKLLENTYRQVNIALVNEMSKYSHALGIDFWDVINCAATKPFGFSSFRPGIGVGGHCIPIDPNYLNFRVREQLGYPAQFIELAHTINSSMPEYVARRAQDILNAAGLAASQATVGLVGVTYKPGIADQRESPSIPLRDALLRLGSRVTFYDPMVSQWNAQTGPITRTELSDLVNECDLVIYAHHYADVSGKLESAARVLDTTGRLEFANVVRL